MNNFIYGCVVEAEADVRMTVELALFLIHSSAIHSNVAPGPPKWHGKAGLVLFTAATCDIFIKCQSPIFSFMTWSHFSAVHGKFV